jgi:hypothetical protein
VTIYKDFDLNTPGDPPPWGDREIQAFRDIIDTVVADTLGEKDTSGHKHTKVYNGYSSVIFDANNTGSDIFLGGDPETQSGQTFQFNMNSSFTVEGNASPAQHVDLFSITYGGSASTDYIKIGEGGTQRVNISLKDLYENAFRLKVGSDDVINVSTASGNRYTKIGSPGVTYPTVMTSSGDVYTRPWSEITTNCTISGFLDFTPESHVWMRQIGGLVFVQMYIIGTSDNPFVSVKFPFIMEGTYKSGSFYGFDSSGNFNVVGAHTSESDTLTTESYLGIVNFWQNTGTKCLSGSFVTSVTNPQFTIS